MKSLYSMLSLLVVGFSLNGCGIKIDEKDAQSHIQAIYKVRKSGNVSRELTYYAKDDFTMVPFEQMKTRLYNVVGRAGRLKKVKPLTSKTQNRNQLGKGTVRYLILSYEAVYAKMTIIESYYFLGSSEKPKLVYMTFEM